MVLYVIINFKCASGGGSKNLNCSGRYPLPQSSGPHSVSLGKWNSPESNHFSLAMCILYTFTIKYTSINTLLFIILVKSTNNYMPYLFDLFFTLRCDFEVLPVDFTRDVVLSAGGTTDVDLPEGSIMDGAEVDGEEEGWINDFFSAVA